MEQREKRRAIVHISITSAASPSIRDEEEMHRTIFIARPILLLPNCTMLRHPFRIKRNVYLLYNIIVYSKARPPFERIY